MHKLEFQETLTRVVNNWEYFEATVVSSGTNFDKSLLNITRSAVFIHEWKNVHRNCQTQSSHSNGMHSLAISQAQIHKSFDICIIICQWWIFAQKVRMNARLPDAKLCAT